MTKTKKYARQASFALLCIFFLVYAIYHIGNAFREKTELFTVTEETLEYTSDLSGYIFRDERVLYGAGDACSYNYANGEKVAKNSVVAKSYYADESKLAKSIKELTGRIEILEKSCSVLHIDLEQTDKEISRLRAEIAEKTASGNVAYVNSAQKDLLILLHKRSLAEQNKNSYASEISILKAELTSLKASAASLGADVITPSSGYFYSYTDGLESVFSASAAESISFESFDAAVSAKPSKSSAAIGKVASIGKWYFVCKTTISQSEEIVSDSVYNCVFKDNACESTLPMTVENKITDYVTGEVLLVFSTSNVYGNLDFSREQRIKVIIEEITGLRVPASSVRVENGQTIVYIIKEGVCRPRKINIIFEKSGYCIVSMPSGAEFLELYDRIIINEKGLFDGMVIDY